MYKELAADRNVASGERAKAAQLASWAAFARSPLSNIFI